MKILLNIFHLNGETIIWFNSKALRKLGATLKRRLTITGIAPPNAENLGRVPQSTIMLIQD